MRKSSISLIVILALTLFVLVISACVPRSKGEAILFVAAPMSGFQANGGQTVVGGVRLRAEEVNRAGGVAGYTIKVVALDDESDPDVALSITEEVKAALDRGDNVLGFIGHYNSGETLAAMEVYGQLPLVVITSNASNVALTQKGYDKFFRIVANDQVQADADAQFLTEQLGARRIAILYNDTAYGRGLYDEMSRALRERGAEVVLAREVKEGQDRYADEVAAIRAAQPDAIFYAGYEIEAPYLRADLVEAGITLPMLASDGAFLSATIDEAAGTAEGMYVSAFGPSPAAVADPDWIEAYQAVEYRNPDTYSINGYAAAEVLLAGVAKAGTLDADRVAKAIRGLNINTMIGQVAYDEKGDRVNAPIYIYQVQNSA
ncbi:MAG: branched-chain amino acid ABC transporter substrate-binding protein, partial [Chloroflexi bacterium]|nr:branched-chain amino acid ABC transporter substrate-binding protein [Chloroflexota bacterium]